MRRGTMRHVLCPAVALIAAVLVATAAPAAAADQPAPALPSSGSGSGSSDCAKASEQVVRAVPWQQTQLDPQGVWPLSRGAGVTVAVLDSGVNAAAPALAGRVLPGIDVTTGGRADDDCLGHGTFVAGIIAAAPVTGVRFVGMAPQARILPVRIVPSSGNVTADLIASGVRAAVDGGATIIDLSVGSATDSGDLRGALGYAEQRGVLVVIGIDDGVGGSATSNGQNRPLRQFPAAYPTVLAVDGVGQDGATTLSSPNPSMIRVDLTAPGIGLLSIGPSGPGHYLADGATFAAGFVAGTAALVRAYHPQLTAAQVRQRLARTADWAGTALPDAAYGYGIVDPYQAVAAVLPEESGVVAATVVAPAAPRPEVAGPAGHAPEVAAWSVVGAVTGGAALLWAAIAAVRRGRQRNWRPSA